MPPIELPRLAEAQIVSFIAVLARVGGIFVFAPVFSSRMIPARAKLIAAGAIALAITPLAAPSGGLPTEPLALVGLLGGEVLVGLGFALVIGLLAAAVQAAAGLLDTLVGFSFAAIVDPISNAQTAVFGQFYSLLTVMVVLLSGGDRLIIRGLATSYELLPLGHVPSAGALGELAASGLGTVAIVALEIAAPVVLALALVDAALGLVARAAPQINVFIVGLPAKILIGIMVVAASLPFVARHVDGELERAVENALRALGGG